MCRPDNVARRAILTTATKRFYLLFQFFVFVGQHDIVVDLRFGRSLGYRGLGQHGRNFRRCTPVRRSVRAVLL